MKRTISLLLLLGLLLSVAALYGCGRRAPKLEEIYDRVVELVEASYELNVIFYGEGLPYYDRTQPIYSALYGDYTKDKYTKDYNIVSQHAKYRTVEAIKAAAEQVYSKTLLEETVYPSAFVGLLSSDAGSGVHYANARYLQDDDQQLYILIENESNERISPTPLVYDYSTMKIVRPSNSTRVLISIDAWEENKPDEILKEQLTLTLIDGVWYLDSLTV